MNPADKKTVLPEVGTLSAELSDEALKNISGGTTVPEIIQKINQLYPWIPEEIRTKIIDALNMYGPKAAKALAKKLTAGTLYEKLADLIPG